ncbi:hypothetical protein PG988_002348 [Apiospora saccharicola]
MEFLLFLSLILGFAAQAMGAVDEDSTPSRVQSTEENFAVSPVDLGKPEMVQKRAKSPDNLRVPPNGISTPFTMVLATFFYTLDNGTVFNYTGEPHDFELELKKQMPSYQIKQLDCYTGIAPPKRFVGPRHEGDEIRGVPTDDDVAGAARPRLAKRDKSNTPSPGGNLVNCLADMGKVNSAVECLVRDLVADGYNGSPTTVRVENGQCSRIRCTGSDASLFWCNFSHHPKRVQLSTFSVPVADINAKCGGNQDDDGRGSVEGNAWNDYNHTMADSRVYVGKCACNIPTTQCGKAIGGLAPGYTSDTT